MSKIHHSLDKSIYLNIGCGLSAPHTWVNIDASWNARLAKLSRFRQLLCHVKPLQAKLSIPWPQNIKIHDVRRGIPYPTESVNAIYASHLLEHLYRSDAAFFIEECYRVLRPYGLLRVVVPDLGALVDRYVLSRKQSYTENSAIQFMEALLICPDFGRCGWVSRVIRSANDLHSHKWMYDEPSLISLIHGKGFSSVSRKGFRDSQISIIADVEQKERFENSVCVEATR